MGVRPPERASLGWTTKPFTRSDRLTISVAGQDAVKDRPLIGGCRRTIYLPEKGKQTEQGRQQRVTAEKGILNVDGGDDAGSSKPCVSIEHAASCP